MFISLKAQRLIIIFMQYHSIYWFIYIFKSKKHYISNKIPIFKHI